MSAKVGEHDISSSTGTTVWFSRKIVHPGYDAERTDNDIALLETEAAMTLGPNVRGACRTTQNKDFYVGKKVTISGWGATREGEMLKYRMMILVLCFYAPPFQWSATY